MKSLVVWLLIVETSLWVSSSAFVFLGPSFVTSRTKVRRLSDSSEESAEGNFSGYIHEMEQIPYLDRTTGRSFVGRQADSVVGPSDSTEKDTVSKSNRWNGVPAQAAISCAAAMFSLIGGTFIEVASATSVSPGTWEASPNTARVVPVNSTWTEDFVEEPDVGENELSFDDFDEPLDSFTDEDLDDFDFLDEDFLLEDEEPISPEPESADKSQPEQKTEKPVPQPNIEIDSSRENTPAPSKIGDEVKKSADDTKLPLKEDQSVQSTAISDEREQKSETENSKVEIANAMNTMDRTSMRGEAAVTEPVIPDTTVPSAKSEKKTTESGSEEEVPKEMTPSGSSLPAPPKLDEDSEKRSGANEKGNLDPMNAGSLSSQIIDHTGQNGALKDDAGMKKYMDSYKDFSELGQKMEAGSETTGNMSKEQTNPSRTGVNQEAILDNTGTKQMAETEQQGGLKTYAESYNAFVNPDPANENLGPSRTQTTTGSPPVTQAVPGVGPNEAETSEESSQGRNAASTAEQKEENQVTPLTLQTTIPEAGGEKLQDQSLDGQTIRKNEDIVDDTRPSSPPTQEKRETVSLSSGGPTSDTKDSLSTAPLVQTAPEVKEPLPLTLPTTVAPSPSREVDPATNIGEGKQVEKTPSGGQLQPPKNEEMTTEGSDRYLPIGGDKSKVNSGIQSYADSYKTYVENMQSEIKKAAVSKDSGPDGNQAGLQSYVDSYKSFMDSIQAEIKKATSGETVKGDNKSLVKVTGTLPNLHLEVNGVDVGIIDDSFLTVAGVGVASVGVAATLIKSGGVKGSSSSYLDELSRKPSRDRLPTETEEVI